jgi:hypothetical protein
MPVPARRLGEIGAASLLLAVTVSPLNGQGVSTAAIQGRITANPRSPVPLEVATVLVTNTPTGHRWRVAAGRDGRFFLENLPVGGPYSIRVDSPGFEASTRSGITLGLGQRFLADFVLDPVLMEVEEITVRVDPLTDAARTGPEHRVDRSTVARLPVRDREILDLALESPHAKATPFGVSIAGHDAHYNNYQIDGGVNSNLYGIHSSTPGGLINLLTLPAGSGLRTVPIDAVKELQVLTSPFDVRQGGFVGGVINVVTESGTNTFQGSVFGTVQTDALAGGDQPDFTTGQYGGTLGGPILPDRLHYFLAADLQGGGIPYDRPLIGADTVRGADSVGVGIRNASATRFQSILRDIHGVEAGSFGAVDAHNPARSLFGKLSWQLETGSLLEISQSYVHGRDRGLFLDRDGYGNYDLSSADILFGSTTTATRAHWSSLLGNRASVEVIGAFLRIRDFCRPRADTFPFVSVLADQGILYAGDKFSCGARRQDLDQDAVEITGNLTVGLGAHRLTGGTHQEFLRFGDPFFPNSAGFWSFESLDSLAQGTPSFYTRTFPSPLRPEGPRADFRVGQLGFYLQDQWSPVGDLILTLGLRLDVPFFPDHPPANPLLASELGIDNGTVPSGNTLWSPRLGFHYDAGGDDPTVVRGGIGLFAGRPAYALVGDPYRSTGMDQLSVFCFGDDVPAFTLDPANQPEACRAGEAVSSPLVSFFDRDLRFPQDLKIALGMDRRLPWGLVATADLLYSRATQQGHFLDVNLLPPGDVVAGEGNRPLYGDMDPATGFTTPRRRSAAFGTVIEQTNRSGDESLFLTAQLRGRIRDRLEFDASYAYSDSRDLLSLSGGLFSLSGLGLSGDQIASTPLDGTLENRRRGPAQFDQRHGIRASGTMMLPYDMVVSAIYWASSGIPYTYVIDGDANGDGFGETRFGQQSNDIVYVPRNSAPGGDITLVVFDPERDELVPAPASEYALFEKFIRHEECLREQRGTILRRGSCRNPWQSELDLRVSKSISVGGGHRAEITLDLFNLPNFLNSDWGIARSSVPFFTEELPLLHLVGFDVAHDRGIYELNLPSPEGFGNWQAQLSMRYAF